MIFTRDAIKHVAINVYEEGAILNALNEMRTRHLTAGKPTDVENELILKIIHTQARKVRVRDEAR